MRLHRLLTILLLAVAAAAQVAPVTLTTPASPQKAPDTAGFLQRWLLLEPIESNGLTDHEVQTAVKKEYFPDQLTVVPKDGDKVMVGGTQLTWHAVDTKLYNVNLIISLTRSANRRRTCCSGWSLSSERHRK